MINLFTVCQSKVFLSLLVGAIAVSGDSLIKFLHSNIAKAVCDNLTHALIGGVSWLVVAAKYDLKYGVMDAFICAILSSGIDIDHFIAARSLYMKDAVRLPSRPFLHSTTLTIVSCVSMLLIIDTLQLSTALNSALQRVTWLCIMAFLSHHIRDGNRRGIWLWPLPYLSNYSHYSTPPIPKALYIALIIALPHFISFIIFPDDGHIFSREKNVIFHV